MKKQLFLFSIIMTFSSFGFTQTLNVSQEARDKLKFKKILFVVAMHKEAEPIIKTFHLQKLVSPFAELPMQAYQGNYAGSDIFMVTNGEDPIYKVQNVGTQPAVLATYLGIKHFNPDLVISVGTAGGVKNNGARLKQIYLSTKIYFYDRRLPSGSSHEYGLGGYTSVNLKSIVDKTSLKLGIVCSGDSFDDNKTDTTIINQLGCVAVDMEAAGVAWTSMLMKKPMFAMKGITNFSQDKNGHLNYKKNSIYVTNELAQSLKLILNHEISNS